MVNKNRQTSINTVPGGCPSSGSSLAVVPPAAVLLVAEFLQVRVTQNDHVSGRITDQHSPEIL